MNNDVIRPIDFAPVSLFIPYILATSSGKLLECVDYGHAVCLVYKPLKNRKNSKDSTKIFDKNSENLSENQLITKMPLIWKHFS